jgi:hypothetical protein
MWEKCMGVHRTPKIDGFLAFGSLGVARRQRVPHDVVEGRVLDLENLDRKRERRRTEVHHVSVDIEDLDVETL